VAVAQQLFYKRISINNAARRGEYTPALEA